MQKLIGLFAFTVLLPRLLGGVPVDGLCILSPKDGASVPILNDGQRAFLSSTTKEITDKLWSSEEGLRLAALGDKPLPVTFAWADTEPTEKAIYRITIGARPAMGKDDSFVVTNLTSVRLTNFESDRDYAWSVERLERGKTSVCRATFKTSNDLPRFLNIPGVRNYRDFGGRVGRDGRRIRQGRIFRSAELNEGARQNGGSLFDASFEVGKNLITATGAQELRETFDIRTDLDIRSDKECAGMTKSPIGGDVRWVHIPVRAYEYLDNDHAALAQIFRVFTEEANYPITFHCAAGRDRAGSIATILGGLLGESEEDLYRDWAASALVKGGATPDWYDGLIKMLNSYSGKTLNDRIEAFVRACGITSAEIERFRELMLEPHSSTLQE